MNKRYKKIAYLFVAILVVVISFLFTKIFAFNKDVDSKVPEVTQDLVDKLYAYLPSTELNKSIYVPISNNQNVYYATKAEITYRYILKYDYFILENLSAEELSPLNIQGKPEYKISNENFLKNMYFALGKDVSYVPANFTIDNETEAYFYNNYYYIYKKDYREDNKYIYKRMNSYTVRDDNKTIIIEDKYLHCDKSTSICYNDGNETLRNNNIKYMDNLNFKSLENNMQTYKHTFKYEDGYYYWEKSEIKNGV